MAYVIREDIIASIDELVNIKQGESNNFTIKLQRDFLGNELNAKKVSVISVSILNRNGQKILMFNNPVAPGVSDYLTIGAMGDISFEITEIQSARLEAGDLNVQISLTYLDYFPNAKTYILPTLKIGQIIAGDPINPPTDPGTDTGSKDNVTYVIQPGTPLFEIEHIDLDFPSSYGKMSINSQNPDEVTSIIFRNLDKNMVRSTILENFVVNRMSADDSEGIITLYSTEDSNLFAMYKITGWQRVDATSGNGDLDDSDAIKIEVKLEGVSTGPGVSKNIWEIGNEVTFSIDSYGITGKDIKPDGILTYTDKNKKVTKATDGAESQTGVYITYSPYYDSYVMVEVNGISIDLGDNTKNATAYFSGNNGETAVEIEAIRAGDQLIWNGDIAGFELEVGDEINLIYEVDVDDLR